MAYTRFKCEKGHVCVCTHTCVKMKWTRVGMGMGQEGSFTAEAYWIGSQNRAQIPAALLDTTSDPSQRTRHFLFYMPSTGQVLNQCGSCSGIIQGSPSHGVGVGRGGRIWANKAPSPPGWMPGANLGHPHVTSRPFTKTLLTQHHG